MKKIYILLFFVVVALGAKAQNVGIGTVTPEESAVLDLNATDKGFLLPRLTEKQKALIPSPAEGLMIYQTDSQSGVYVFQKGLWSSVNSTANAVSAYTPNYLLIADGSGNISSSNIFYNSSSQKYGIGTSNPTLALDIVGNSTSGGLDGIGFGNLGAGHSNKSYFGLTGSGFSYSGIGPNTTLIGAAATSKMAFLVEDNNPIQFLTNYQERMRITPTGKIGFGTTNPTFKMEVLGESLPGSIDGIAFGNSASGHSNKAFFGLTGSGFSYSGIGPNTTMVGAAATSKLAFFTEDNNPIQFLTNYQERMRITPTGKIGFGTTNPSFKMEVLGESLPGSVDGIAFGNIASGHSNKAFFGLTGSGFSYSGIGPNTTMVGAAATSKLAFFTEDNNPIQFLTNYQERMRITPTGKIGFGTTNPSFKMEVLGESVSGSVDGIAFGNIASGHSNKAYFGISGSGFSYGNLGANSTIVGAAASSKLALLTEDSNPIQFLTNYLERMRISPTGNVGIGNNNDRYKFEVLGTSYFSEILKVNSKSTGYLAVGDFDAATPMSIPAGYRLIVQDGIITEKVKVALRSSTADWADYVFDKNYKLNDLNFVENYINEHKHLPNVPSADDLVNNGLDIGKTSKMFMEKIEELTLYIIQLKKEIDELKNK